MLIRPPLRINQQRHRQVIAHENTLMTHSREPSVERPPAELTGVVERNIRTLLERRRADDHRRGWEDRLADGITRFTGSMRFVYLHLFVFGLWIVVNLPWSPLPRFDLSYIVLAMVASVEAIFLSTFILITQNRITAEADKRADLDLHISLLAEHEITRLIGLVTAMARQMGVPRAKDPEFGELTQDVAPDNVLNAMEAPRQQVTARESRSRKP
jgi:uncharacterized membrane protein